MSCSYRELCVGWKRLESVVRGVLLVALVLTASDWSRAEETSQSTTWAVLIGVENYDHPKVTPLEYTSKDVKLLAETLSGRGGIPRKQILEISDLRSDEFLKPTKQAIVKKLEDWLAKPKQNDTILIYFSGHGVQDKDGKLYLAPRDCNPDDLAGTGISLAWFQTQLANCRAELKLLILDACHAGSSRGDAATSINPEKIGEKLEDIERVMIIASCKARESSLIWPAKEQSLFSYWLNQGLRGHADKDSDGVVNVQELYEYVSRHVKRSAKGIFGLDQSPVRLVRLAVEGTPTVVKLQPQSLDQMLSDMAEQLAYHLEEQQIPKVGVLPFITVDPTGNEGLGAEYGSLGKYCAEELQRQLEDRCVGKFSVIDQRRLEAALKKESFVVKDLGQAMRLKSLAKNVDGMPVITVGQLMGRKKNILRMQCKLQRTGDDDTDLGAMTKGIAALTESECAAMQLSFVVKPEDRRVDYRPAQSSTAEAGNSVPSQVISAAEERSELPHSHPMDPQNREKFQFRVALEINGKERQGVFRGNDYLVPVRKGDKYRIMVENNSGDVAVMRLLVDGLNTLPEKEYARQTTDPSSPNPDPSVPQTVAQKGIVTEIWGMHVSLEHARAWILDPAELEPKRARPTWAVSGFVTKTGVEGKMKEFVIADAHESLAGSQGFADDIGVITAAFYKPKAGSRGPGTAQPGTKAGAEVSGNLRERSGITAGNLIGVVHIKYVNESVIANGQ